MSYFQISIYLYYDYSSTAQNFFEKCFIDLISTHNDEKQLNNWIQGIIVQIENLLTNSNSNNIKKCLFLLDLFIINVIIISGYHFALSDDHDSAERFVIVILMFKILF